MDEAAVMVRFRIARVVGDLEASGSFYADGLGLPVVTRFADHAGWWGLVLGVPDAGHQLELTWHAEASPHVGGPDDLLVLWYRTPADALAVRARVPEAPEVRPDNPWWWERSVTLFDPDRQRITLAWADSGA